MNLFFLAALSATFIANVAHAQIRIQNTSAPTTWFSTTLFTEEYGSSYTTKYGSSPITPVPTSTAPLVIKTSFVTEPTASRNINRTTWSTAVVTSPLTTHMSVVYNTTPLPPSIVTASVTTADVWISPVVATITFTRTACQTDSNTTINDTMVDSRRVPTATTTEYTGTYIPIPGQITTTHLRTAFPTAITIYRSITVSSRVYPYTGHTVIYTSTVTGTTYLSTTTSTFTATAGGGRYTSTRYLTTVTATKSDHQLAYTTTTVIPSSCVHPDSSSSSNSSTAATVTVTKTQHLKCHPTHLLSEQSSHGLSVRLLPLSWTFPIGFPAALIGIPSTELSADGRDGTDVSTCCQLCADSPGCAASEWVPAALPKYRPACRLYYYIDPEGKGTDTCGTGNGEVVELEYFADVYALPGQGGFIQAGCGRLKYLGVMDPFCPTCKVDQG